MTVVRLDGVGVRAGAIQILSDVEIGVSAGERVALVGSSGAGKTTLLRVIAGQQAVGAGQVRVLGRDPAELAPRERSALVGLVPQGLGLVPQLTARANLHSGLAGRLGFWRSLAVLALPVEVAGVRESADALGIGDLLGRRVSSLSGGERQRVAISRLALQAPAVVLADEPVSSVDPALAEQVIDLLAATSPEGTLMASLHNPDIALRRFDRVIGISGGLVTFDRPVTELDTAALQSLYRGDPG